MLLLAALCSGACRATALKASPLLLFKDLGNWFWFVFYFFNILTCRNKTKISGKQKKWCLCLAKTKPSGPRGSTFSTQRNFEGLPAFCGSLSACLWLQLSCLPHSTRLLHGHFSIFIFTRKKKCSFTKIWVF